MSEKLKIGLIGVGAISQLYANVLRDCPVGRLVAIADVRNEAVDATAETWLCKGYSSHKELAEHADCDAIILCTPPSTHVEIATFFVDRGIPLLCEKPLSTDVDSARTICDRAQSKGVKMAMASKFRYVDDVIHAKSIISSGILGEIVLFENTFAARVDMEHRWNSDRRISGGGVLIDNGTHSVDIARYLFGPISEVLAVEGRRTQNIEVEDTANLFVHTASGAIGQIDLSWSLNKDIDTYVRVYGTDGTVQIGWQESRYRQAASSDWVTFGNGYDKLLAFRRQITNFCNYIRGTEALLISNEDAVASVEVIQAAYDSLSYGQWISVLTEEQESKPRIAAAS